MISMISADPSENLNENSRIDRFKENQKNKETILGGRDSFNFLKREKSSHWILMGWGENDRNYEESSAGQYE